MSERLYLWRISQAAVTGPGTYRSAVVVAPDEVSAAFVHPGSGPRPSWSHRMSAWIGGNNAWAPPSEVSVQRLGVADDDYDGDAVVCTSLNAGWYR